jgi:uncharacterized membrane-anchored protein YitT (DUF2179 family)
MPGGFSGLSLAIYHAFGRLTPGIWYFVLNIPLFITGWIFLSRRFFFYSRYGLVAVTLPIDLISFVIPIDDRLLAALAAGALIVAGAGTYRHSFGSVGGSDVIAIPSFDILLFDIRYSAVRSFIISESLTSEPDMYDY